MEKIKKSKSVTSTHQDPPKKCSLTKENEEILSEDLEKRLSLKTATNGLLNGLTSSDNKNHKHDSNFVKQNETNNCNKEPENCLNKKGQENSVCETNNEDNSCKRGTEIDDETNITANTNDVDATSECSKQQLPEISYVQYESELQMPMIMKIIQKDLSEPYSIYTYRYFIHNWPKLCFLVSIFHLKCELKNIFWA